MMESFTPSVHHILDKGHCDRELLHARGTGVISGISSRIKKAKHAFQANKQTQMQFPRAELPDCSIFPSLKQHFCANKHSRACPTERQLPQKGQGKCPQQQHDAALSERQLFHALPPLLLFFYGPSFCVFTCLALSSAITTNMESRSKKVKLRSAVRTNPRDRQRDRRQRRCGASLAGAILLKGARARVKQGGRRAGRGSAASKAMRLVTRDLSGHFRGSKERYR